MRFSFAVLFSLFIIQSSSQNMNYNFGFNSGRSYYGKELNNQPVWNDFRSLRTYFAYEYKILEFSFITEIGRFKFFFWDEENHPGDYWASGGSWESTTSFDQISVESRFKTIKSSLCLGLLLSDQNKNVFFIPRFSFGMAVFGSRLDYDGIYFTTTTINSYNAPTDQYSSNSTDTYYNPFDAMNYQKNIRFIEIGGAFRFKLKNNFNLEFFLYRRKYLDSFFNFNDYFSNHELNVNISLGYKFDTKNKSNQ